MSILQGDTVPPQGSQIPWWSSLALVLALCATLQLRLHTLTEPLDCDESAYTYVGHRLLLGDRPYVDVFENKPPLAYAIYSSGVALGGYGERAIRVLPIPFALGTVFFCWLFAQRFAGPVAATCSVALYAVVSSDPFVFANSANLEVFMCFWLAVALWATAVAARPGPWQWCVVAGLAAGCASAIKQVAILHALLFGSWITLTWVSGRDWRRAALSASAFLAGFVVPWFGCILFVVARGAHREFAHAVFVYGPTLASEASRALVQQHAADDAANLPAVIARLVENYPSLWRLVWLARGNPQLQVWWGSGSWPLILLASGSTFIALCCGRIERFWLCAASVAVAYAEIVWTGLFWQHYYVIPVPGLAIMSGMAISQLLERLGRQADQRRWMIGGCTVLGLMASMWLGAQLATIQMREYLRQTPEQICVRHKAGTQWLALRELGTLLRRLPIANAKLFVWGWQSPLHVYSGLDSVTPYFFTDPLMQLESMRNHPLVEPRKEKILADIKERAPELIFVGEVPFPELAEFLAEKYDPARESVGRSTDGRGLYGRRDVIRELDTYLTGR
jgi:hypothetical protein